MYGLLCVYVHIFMHRFICTSIGMCVCVCIYVHTHMYTVSIYGKPYRLHVCKYTIYKVYTSISIYA
jgi:hypothetical protein